MTLEPDQGAVKWVASRLNADPRDFEPYRSAFVRNRHGAICAGIVFSRYRPKARSVEISVAADSPHWLSRGVIRGCLRYAFGTLNCIRLEAHTKDTGGAGYILESFGFTYEGALRRAWDGVNDTSVFSLLWNEAGRWYNPENCSEVKNGRTRAAADPRPDAGQPGSPGDEPVQPVHALG